MIVTYLLDSSTLPDPIEFPEGMKGLPKDRVEKINRLKHQESRKQSFGAGLLLVHGLHQAAVCNIETGDSQCRKAADELLYIQNSRKDEDILKDVCYNSHGKPYLAHTPFNLSHTDSYVILSILTLQGLPEKSCISIGCDIEQVKAYNPRIARRFFTNDECQKLEETERQSQAELFCRYWTRKESVMKMVGLGMALPMDLFDISSSCQVAADREKTLSWQASVKEKTPEKIYNEAVSLLLTDSLYLQEYQYNNCCITVCSNYNQFAENLRLVYLS